jgi:glycosyltransferase involved in cell wall biosynthesis
MYKSKTAVVLVSYNQEAFIFDALEGIRNQTVKPDEVVIADDCSTDRTQDIIKEYIKTYEITEWILSFNPKNLGINLNLQNAVDQTSAEVIIPMSGDDISMPNRIETAIDLFNHHPHLHIVSTSIFKIDENKNGIGELIYNDELINDVKKVIVAGTPNVFPVGQNWKRSIFDKFGKLPGTIPNEDDQITFRALIDGGIFCSSIKTVLYRVHSNSASSWLRNNQSEEEFFERFTKDMLIRKLHMELWKDTLNLVDRPDKAALVKLIELKISLYSLFNEISQVSIHNRLKFLISHSAAVGLRERYYILLGKFGILSWRRIKKLAGR